MLIFGRNKNKTERVCQGLEEIKKSYHDVDMDSLTVGIPATGKSLGVPCVSYNHYNLMRGQMLIVKEMSAPNVIGGVLYDTEMELVEIRGKYIILQDHKGTSSLTGGVAEYCFSIDEIGKNIFPK